MRVFGLFLWFLAVLFFLGGYGMDTTVQTSTGARVHNIGLLGYQQTAIMIAIGLFLGGALFVALGGKGAKGVSAPSEEDTRKCPFCAEPIKKEAIKCKHCGSDVPQETAASGKTKDDQTFIWG